MTSLTIEGTEVGPDDPDFSRITDLVIWGNTLYSTTRYDGRIASWDVDTLAISSYKAHVSGPIAGSAPSLAVVNGALLSGGWTNGTLAFHGLDTDGKLTGTTATSVLAVPMDLTPVSIGGDIWVYSGSANASGILKFGVSGAVLTQQATTTTGAPVLDLATTTVGADQYLVSVAGLDSSVSVYALDGSGVPELHSAIDPSNGLWANAPTAIGSAAVNGETYLIVAGGGSSSLSVLHLNVGGGIQTVDHLLDDLNTRFSGVSALEVVEHSGHVYAIVGGADDGVSILQILPGGRLLHLTSLEDSVDATLANPSAIAARSTATGIDIYVASATKPGITKLRYETGASFDVLIGTAANETLSAGSTNDVLADGEGSDTMTGGDGADVFVLSNDNEVDEITDFELGIDQVDLSAWAGLRSANQIFFSSTATGLQITYGLETLVLRSADSQPIDASDFVALALQIGSRIDQVPVPGFAGPEVVAPSLPNRDPYIPPTQSFATEDEGIQRVGVAEADSLQGTEFDDVLWGQGGNDTLSGNDGSDSFFGGSGNDHVTDFALGVDMLVLDDALWSGTRDAANVVQTFASSNNDHTVFDFGSSRLTLSELTDPATLINSIDII